MGEQLSEKEFQQHLSEEHRLSPFSTYLKEIVYGGIDGIVTTFAVVAGFSGAQAMTGTPTIPMLTVLLFGFANLFADATSMGLGNFLSVRADQDVYNRERKKEQYEVKNSPDFEKKETILLLTEKGFSNKQAEQLTNIYATNEQYWVDFMMKEELEMSNPLDENPYFTGIATFISFIIFGAIPLMPYVFLQEQVANVFTSSIIFTGTALILLGILRWKVTGQRMLKSIGETVLVGSISAIVAYFVGTMFRI